MLTHRCPWCGEKIPTWRHRPKDPISILSDNGKIDTCPSCGKLYKSSSPTLIIIVLVSIAFGGRFIGSLITSPQNAFLKIILSLLWILCLLTALVQTLRLPYCRDYKTSGMKKFFLCSAAVGSLFGSFIILHWIKHGSVLVWVFLTYLAIFLVLDTVVYLHYRSYYKKESRKSFGCPSATVRITWYPHKEGGLVAPKLRIVPGEIFPVCFLNPAQQPISGALCVTLSRLKWSSLHHCCCTIQLVLDDVKTEKLFVPGNTFFLYHEELRIAQGVIEEPAVCHGKTTASSIKATS